MCEVDIQGHWMTIRPYHLCWYGYLERSMKVGPLYYLDEKLNYSVSDYQIFVCISHNHRRFNAKPGQILRAYSIILGTPRGSIIHTAKTISL